MCQSKGGCDWPRSSIYERLNGTGSGSTEGSRGTTNLFVDSDAYPYMKKNSSWYLEIKSHDWWYGDIFEKTANVPADQIYKIETGQLAVDQGYLPDGTHPDPFRWPGDQKVTSKIALIYLHDYYYSSSIDYKNNVYADCYDKSTECTNSWLNISLNGESRGNRYEHTMTRWGRSAGTTYFVWRVSEKGSVSYYSLGQTAGVRPVFYILSSVYIRSGNGTATDPFILNQSAGLVACIPTGKK